MEPEAGWIKRRARPTEEEPVVIIDDDDGGEAECSARPQKRQKGKGGPGVEEGDQDHEWVVDLVRDAVARVESEGGEPEGDDVHACALASHHRLARLDGLAERLREALEEHRRYKATLPGGQFPAALRRRKRESEALEFARDHARIAQSFAKHYNQVFHPPEGRFAARPEALAQGAAPPTRGYHAKAAEFFLKMLVEFNCTFNTKGDLPRPALARPLSDRETAALHTDEFIRAAALADKYEGPTDRARHRVRPPRKPRAPIDLRGPDPRRPAPSGSDEQGRHRLPDDDGDDEGDADDQETEDE
jgi:hypothetical protein